MTAALQAVGLGKSFGGVAATRDVDLTLCAGDRVALIGPNGAGKTTLVDQLTGVQPPDRGRILLGGRDVTRLSVTSRARLGLGRTFQVNRLFPSLSPVQALALAVGERRGRGAAPVRRIGADPAVVAEVAELLDLLALDAVADRPARHLSYGQQRQLDIAMALAGQPRVLILDEPAAGVPEAERRGLLGTLARVPAEVAILMIEHDMDLVFSFARRIVVLVDGAIMAQGTPEQIAADPRVREVYLGQDARG